MFGNYGLVFRGGSPRSLTVGVRGENKDTARPNVGTRRALRVGRVNEHAQERGRGRWFPFAAARIPGG